MSWFTILTWLISFIASYSKTKSAGKAALIATGVAAAAYYTVEPTNRDAIWGDASRDLFGMSVPEGTEAISGTAASPGAGAPAVGSLTQLGKTAIESTADVAKSWGPAGTLGVVTGASLLGSGSTSKWLWIGGIIAGFLLLSK